jgi:hypothetical protein
MFPKFARVDQASTLHYQYKARWDQEREPAGERLFFVTMQSCFA